MTEGEIAAAVAEAHAAKEPSKSAATGQSRRCSARSRPPAPFPPPTTEHHLLRPKESCSALAPARRCPRSKSALAERGQRLISEPPNHPPFGAEKTPNPRRRRRCEPLRPPPRCFGATATTSWASERSTALAKSSARGARAEERHGPGPLQAAHRQPRHARGPHRDHPESPPRARAQRHARDRRRYGRNRGPHPLASPRFTLFCIRCRLAPPPRPPPATVSRRVSPSSASRTSLNLSLTASVASSSNSAATSCPKTLRAPSGVPSATPSP